MQTKLDRQAIRRWRLHWPRAELTDSTLVAVLFTKSVKRFLGGTIPRLQGCHHEQRKRRCCGSARLVAGGIPSARTRSCHGGTLILKGGRPCFDNPCDSSFQS